MEVWVHNARLTSVVVVVAVVVVVVLVVGGGGGFGTLNQSGQRDLSEESYVIYCVHCIMCLNVASIWLKIL